MKRVEWKFYIDYEKEEAWLNSMSEKGFAFTDFFLCRYAFEDSGPGEYIYRIELLENLPGHPESRKYLNFMEENGVEYISSWARWVYFRKKASAGPFDIYSDIESRVAHYRRIATLFFVVMILEISLSIPQFSIWLDHVSGGYRGGTTFNLGAGVLLLCLAAIFFNGWNSTRKKMKELLLEKNLRE